MIASTTNGPSFSLSRSRHLFLYDSLPPLSSSLIIAFLRSHLFMTLMLRRVESLFLHTSLTRQKITNRAQFSKVTYVCGMKPLNSRYGHVKAGYELGRGKVIRKVIRKNQEACVGQGHNHSGEGCQEIVPMLICNLAPYRSSGVLMLKKMWCGEP